MHQSITPQAFSTIVPVLGSAVVMVAIIRMLSANQSKKVQARAWGVASIILLVAIGWAMFIFSSNLGN